MANITMLDSQKCPIHVDSMKNTQVQVISPLPPFTAVSNAPAIVDVTIDPDGVTVWVTGKPGQTVSTNLTVTIASTQNPAAKFQQTFTVQPDPSYPVSLQATPGTPVAQ